MTAAVSLASSSHFRDTMDFRGDLVYVFALNAIDPS